MHTNTNEIKFPNQIRAENIRSPYPKIWVRNILQGFEDYSKKHRELDVVFDKAHAKAYAKLTPIQFADTLINFENLNIGDAVTIFNLSSGLN